MRHALTIFSCLVPLAFCFPNAPTSKGNRRAVGLVAEGLNHVTTEILKAARSVHGCNENLLFSPLSISVSIAMLLEGSGGETELELLRALHLTPSMTQDDLREGFSDLLQSMKGHENEVSHILEIASAIFVQKDIPLKEDFRNILTKKYFALIENKDFQRNVHGVLRDINSWVADKTRNEIPQFLSPGSLSPTTVMYLLNAVYFSGQWESQFPLNGTTITPFFVTQTEQIDVQMMNSEADYRAAFIDELNADAVEVPYEGQRMTMLLIVPKNIDGLRDVERKISSNLIEEILYKKIVHRRVELSMPRLDIGGDMKLKDIMMEMGIRQVFQHNANLSKITPAYDTGLYVDSAKHKAVLKVDEQGTKAAAVTGIGIVPLSGFWEPPQAMVINADRPFMMYIYDWDARIAIFVGSVKKPNVDTSQIQGFSGIPEEEVVHVQEEVMPVQNEEVPVQKNELPQQDELPSREEQGNWEPFEEEYDDSTQVDESEQTETISSEQYDENYDDYSFTKPRNPFNPFTILASQRFKEPISQAKDARSSYDKIVFLGPVYHEYLDE